MDPELESPSKKMGEIALVKSNCKRPLLAWQFLWSPKAWSLDARNPNKSRTTVELEETHAKAANQTQKIVISVQLCLVFLVDVIGLTTGKGQARTYEGCVLSIVFRP